MDRDVRLIRSPISVVGMILTTMSAVLFLIVFLADLFGLRLAVLHESDSGRRLAE